MDSVAIVVLAYNNYADTAECLDSVMKSSYGHLRVYLVDNGSTDETAKKAQEDYPTLTLVQTGENLGVAGGFNAGIVPALQGGADYVFILNNDTVIPEDLITRLVDVAVSDATYGLLMPKILTYDDHTRIWSAGAKYRLFPPAIVMRGLNAPDDGTYDQPVTLEYAPTCGLLISRTAFERAGLFDDGYFFYFDDWDFSQQVRRAGLQIRYVPEATFYHKVSLTIRNRNRQPFFWRTWGKSGARFYRRFGQPVWWSALVHLGYLALREGVRTGPRYAYYFVQGAIEGFRQPMTAPPAFTETASDA